MRNSCYLHAKLSLFDYMSFTLHAVCGSDIKPDTSERHTVTAMRNSCYLHAALSLHDYMSFTLHAIAAVTSNPIRVNVKQ